MLLAYGIVLGGSIIFLTLYFLLLRNKVDLFKLLKVISVVTFVAIGASLYIHNAIDSTVKLEDGPFGPFMTIFMVALRTFTTIVLACSIFYPYYKAPSFKRILTYIMPIITILNLVFLNENLIAIYGYNYDPFLNYRTYAFLVQMMITLSLSVIMIFEKIKAKDFNDTAKDIGKMFLVFFLLVPAFFQQGALMIFFGEYGDTPEGFNGIHRFTMYFTVAVMIIPYIVMRNKPLQDKKLFYGILAFSALIQYFYEVRTGLSGLPLHLCNTAVILMFLAFVFKWDGVFYFSYFVNVLGAIFATVLPDNGRDAFALAAVHYWYNHIYAIVLPILGVALKVYPRPNIKMMYKAIGFFTLYFVTVCFINAWFNNYGTVDYFFVYGDFFIEKVSAVSPLKYNYILQIPVGGLVFKFFYVYQATIYVVFIALMFVIWMIYDALYKVSDRHYELLMIKKQKKMDMLHIKELYKGQSLSEPLNKEATKMIKIEHFTKKYAGSKKPSVDDFSLEIHDGEVFGFLGHNGAGKSTTIKSMVGIQSITSGNIIIDGYDVKKQPLEAKLRVGYVSDNHAVYEKLTGREYINYVADLYLVPQEERDVRIKKYVEMFNLTDAIDREIKGYSHGMKQKIVVIASLIHNPKVWILDEPLTGLDPTSSFQIKECMREHANNGNIVFFSSHVIEVVEKICDKICIIQRGKLVGVYAIKDLAAQGLTLEQLYMKHVAQANYNTYAPDATKVFEAKKKETVK